MQITELAEGEARLAGEGIAGGGALRVGILSCIMERER